jgi:hypothetical protein
MKYLGIVFFILWMAAVCSCDKPPGEGGLATLQGRVILRDYNSSFTVFLGSFPAREKRVYIIYGDNQIYSDDFRTDHNGYYAFRYLRPGKYTLYTMGKDSTFQSPDGKIPVFLEVEVKPSDRVVELPDLIVLD